MQTVTSREIRCNKCKTVVERIESESLMSVPGKGCVATKWFARMRCPKCGNVDYREVNFNDYRK